MKSPLLSLRFQKGGIRVLYMATSIRRYRKNGRGAIRETQRFQFVPIVTAVPVVLDSETTFSRRLGVVVNYRFAHHAIARLHIV